MASPGTTAVDVRSVRKVFDAHTSRAVTALKQVSLSIFDNEFFTLLGPSGCGKTTLLRLIAGFEQPTDGHILLFGDHLEGLPPHKRPVNTVFQQYALFPHMTVAENIGFSLEMLGRGKAEIAQTVRDMLELVKMQDFADRKPAQLSGGQQQRIALARALAPQPKVLLLDEPLSALDLKLRQAMRVELKSLQAKTGITFIFVTHDQEEALTMSDRVAVMSEGEVQQIGTPEEIYENPANRFVADFIGETNFIPGRIIEINHAAAKCEIPGGGVLQADLQGGQAVGDQVILVVRPEKLEFVSGGVNGASCALEGQIADRVYLGTDTAYQVALPGDLTLMVRDQNTVAGEIGYGLGDQVTVRVAFGAARMLAA